MTMPHYRGRSSYGFSLIEMLTVLVIIAILAQYLVSVSMQAREKAYRTTCISNLRQLLQACKMYESDYGQLPVHCHGTVGGIDSGEGWWQLTTFPYVRNRDIYLCPLDPDRGLFPGHTGGGPTEGEYCSPDHSRRGIEWRLEAVQVGNLYPRFQMLFVIPASPGIYRLD